MISHPNYSKPHNDESKIKLSVAKKLLNLMYEDEKKILNINFNEFQMKYKNKFSSNDLSVFENYFNNFEELYKKLYKESELEIIGSSNILCIENNEIHSINEWRNLGFSHIKDVINGKRETSKNLHFIKINLFEYENNINMDENFYKNKYLKLKIYVKCIETSEIYTDSEWRKMGYSHVKLIINGERNVEKGKHFIKSTKEEYESYLKQLSSVSA